MLCMHSAPDSLFGAPCAPAEQDGPMSTPATKPAPTRSIVIEREMLHQLKKEIDVTDTYLAPIEQPQGLIMKLAYYFTRRQFGKVLTPLKVHSARLPPAFGLFYAKVAKLDEKLLLPQELVLLIREQVARTNVCLFCIDIGRATTIKKSMNEAKFDALERYGTSSLFSDAERAALDYVTELTKDKR